MMTRTPDEIKKGLECCVIGASAHQPKCGECPYELVIACSDELLKDAAGLVQRFEAERDAAIENIRGDCVYCLHLCEDMVAPSCFDCANKGYYRWEWRGVPKEG